MRFGSAAFAAAGGYAGSVTAGGMPSEHIVLLRRDPPSGVRSARSDDGAAFLPTVLWHGLGDSDDSDGIRATLASISNHTGAPAFAVTTGGRSSSFFGDINAQLPLVAAALSAEDALAGGFNALGFSQGGQFLRGLLERHGLPLAGSLLTYGSQHSGIAEVPCDDPSAFLCRSVRSYMRGNAFGDWVQHNIVPASYYRGADDEAYRRGSLFLAGINNERLPAAAAAAADTARGPGGGLLGSSDELVNSTYANHIAHLHNFVMVKFDADQTVVPAESSHFALVRAKNSDKASRQSEIDADADEVNANGDSDGEDADVIPLEKTRPYKRLGLDKLAQVGKLHRLTVPGKHMQIDESHLLELIDTYFARRRDVEKNKPAAGEHGDL